MHHCHRLKPRRVTTFARAVSFHILISQRINELISNGYDRTRTATATLDPIEYRQHCVCAAREEGLEAAKGIDNRQIVRPGVGRIQIGRWRERFAEGRLAVIALAQTVVWLTILEVLLYPIDITKKIKDPLLPRIHCQTCGFTCH